MTFIRFNEVYIINGNDKYPQYNDEKFEWTPQPETQTPTTLRFKIPEDVTFKLGGKLVIDGEYTHHKGGFRQYKKEIEIKY